jgi:hypothetical protein
MALPETPTSSTALRYFPKKRFVLIENAWQNPRSPTHAQRLGIVIVRTN